MLRLLPLVVFGAAPLLGAFLGTAQEEAPRPRPPREPVQEEPGPEKPPPRPEAAGGAFSLSFEEGIHYRSPEGPVDLHVGGLFQAQVRETQDRPGSLRSEPNRLYVRDAFLSLDGRLLEDFDLLVNGDLASRFDGPVAGLEEAFLRWRRYPEASVRLGQFRPPAGTEILTPPAFTDCIERSILSRFVTDLVLGAEVNGELWERRIAYQVAAGEGRANPSGGGPRPRDNNDGRDVWARLVIQPWAELDSEIRGLSAGFFGSLGSQDRSALSSEFAVETTELGVTFLEPSAASFEGRRSRAGLELSYVVGPGSLRAEYLQRSDRVSGAPGLGERTLSTQAWYAQASVIVFGAEKLPGSRIVPSSPLRPDLEDWGAVEIVFRVAGAWVSRGVLESLGNAMGGESTRLSTTTLGVNWIPLRNVRLSLDLVREEYQGRVDFGNGKTRGSLDGLLARFQIDF